MAVTSLLELLAISESQTQKATAINTAFSQIEQAVADTYSLNTDAAVSVDFDVVLPFDDANDLTSRTALRFILLVIAAGSAENFNVIHPDNKHLFFVRNDAAHVATVKTASGTGIALSPNQTAILYCDGTNVIDLSGAFITAAITQAYDFEVAVYNKPINAQVIGKFVVPREVSFGADFAGSVGNAGTNPTATATFAVNDDGIQIGTISVSTGGVFTFTTTSNEAKVVAAGSVITVVSQATADATLADVNVSLLGSISVAQ